MAAPIDDAHVPDVAAFDLENPVHCGFLNKKRPSKKYLSVKYQKRWCVIHDGIFYYFESQNDRKQKGAFYLAGYKFFHLAGAENSFAFVKKGSRSFEFIATSRKEFDKWRQALNTVNKTEERRHSPVGRSASDEDHRRRPAPPRGRAIPEVPPEASPRSLTVPRRKAPPPPSSSESEDESYIDPNELNHVTDRRPSPPQQTPTGKERKDRIPSRPGPPRVPQRSYDEEEPSEEYIDVRDIHSRPNTSPLKNQPNPSIAHLLASHPKNPKTNQQNDSDDQEYTEFTQAGNDESDDDLYLDLTEEVPEKNLDRKFSSASSGSSKSTGSNTSLKKKREQLSRGKIGSKDSNKFQHTSSEDGPDEIYEVVDEDEEDGRGNSEPQQRLEEDDIYIAYSESSDSSDDEAVIKASKHKTVPEVKKQENTMKKPEGNLMMNELRNALGKKISLNPAGSDKNSNIKSQLEPMYVNLDDKERETIIRKTSNPLLNNGVSKTKTQVPAKVPSKVPPQRSRSESSDDDFEEYENL